MAIESKIDTSDYLFTWSSNPKTGWPPDELSELIERFRRRGFAKDRWRCLAHRKIKRGDRAYFLKQGPPEIGIFGRGVVIGNPKRTSDGYERRPGENPWSVEIRIEQLVDPRKEFLVNQGQLRRLPVPKQRWQTQAAGISLEAAAAREIDAIIDSRGEAASRFDNDATVEVKRQIKLGQQAQRPDQQAFSKMARINYSGKCAVTCCSTSAALEAAHIRTRKGFDDNSSANAILLRSDIHALLDGLLIAISEDGARIEVSPELSDPSYAFLNGAAVAKPIKGIAPSLENIQEHRNRFLQNQKKLRTVQE